MRRLGAYFGALLLSGCSSASGSDSVRALLRLPAHLAEPAIPAYNPLSRAKIALGRRLFYDPRLSANTKQSCSSCHLQRQAFADTSTTPRGSTGDLLLRNSPGLANVAYFSTLTWANNGLLTLEDQILVPILSDKPVELGLTDGARDQVLQRFEQDPDYPALFETAFPGEKSGVTLNKVVFALASFCRSLISADSPYDRYYAGDKSALTEQQLRGLRLFNSERLECFHCHSGINFSTSYHDAETDEGTRTYPFFNTGLYNVGGTGAYPLMNQGLYELTHDALDRGKFRPASLRNVALTPPYGHDGSIPSLRDMVLTYARGGRNVEAGPHSGDGRANPLKSGLVRGFAISPEEIDDVVAFLGALSDPTFLADPALSDPFPARD
jgi:cytochrome c peroxidase